MKSNILGPSGGGDAALTTRQIMERTRGLTTFLQVTYFGQKVQGGCKVVID